MVRGRYGEVATKVCNDVRVAKESSGKDAREGRAGREGGKAGNTQIPRRADTIFTATKAMVPSRPPKPKAELR
jgi:hypothetical protein